MQPDMRRQESKAAQLYMQEKGYPRVRPYAVEAVEGIACWYFYYSLPEGVLELEVERDESGTWHWAVTAFNHHDQHESVDLGSGAPTALTGSR